MPLTWLAGVASGLSVHLGVPVTYVRFFFVLSSFMMGAGAALYVWLWITIEADQNAHSSSESTAGLRLRAVGKNASRQVSRNRLILLGILTIIIATTLFLNIHYAFVHQQFVVGGALALGGLALLWYPLATPEALFIPEKDGRPFSISASTMAGIVGGIILLGGGILLLAIGDRSLQEVLYGGAIGGILILGILIALSPFVWRGYKTVMSSREEQAREKERAEISAHIHDSVLQTLTLIRANAADQQTVRSLALAQERDLRSWLYSTSAEASHSLVNALRGIVTKVESTHGVEIDVVTVGDCEPTGATLALIAAAGEAANNAVTHGQPPVSIYMEVAATRVEAFIKDAGPGFDLNAIAPDRHGVRGSIIGRMERAGGSARLRRLAYGMEVHLIAPREEIGEGK